MWHRDRHSCTCMHPSGVRSPFYANAINLSQLFQPIKQERKHSKSNFLKILLLQSQGQGVSVSVCTIFPHINYGRGTVVSSQLPDYNYEKQHFLRNKKMPVPLTPSSPMFLLIRRNWINNFRGVGGLLM